MTRRRAAGHGFALRFGSAGRTPLTSLELGASPAQRSEVLHSVGSEFSGRDKIDKTGPRGTSNH